MKVELFYQEINKHIDTSRRRKRGDSFILSQVKYKLQVVVATPVPTKRFLGARVIK